jgi:hypothetical protein
MITDKFKYIDVRYYVVWDAIDQGKIKMCKISTHDNPVDIMIKYVSVAKFELCSSLVGITV